MKHSWRKWVIGDLPPALPTGVIWKRMVPLLSTWSPAEEVVWKGLKHLAFLEEVCHCGRGLRLPKMQVIVSALWLIFAHQESSCQFFLPANPSSSSRTWGSGTDKWGQLVSCNSQFYSEHWTVYTLRVKGSHRSKVGIAKGQQLSSDTLHMAAAWSPIETCKQTTVASSVWWITWRNSLLCATTENNPRTSMHFLKKLRSQDSCLIFLAALRIFLTGQHLEPYRDIFHPLEWLSHSEIWAKLNTFFCNLPWSWWFDLAI